MDFFFDSLDFLNLNILFRAQKVTRSFLKRATDYKLQKLSWSLLCTWKLKIPKVFEKNRSRKDEVTLKYIYMEPERKRLHDLWY